MSTNPHRTTDGKIILPETTPKRPTSILGLPIVTTDLDLPIVTTELVFGDSNTYSGRIPAKVVEDATVTMYRVGFRAALYRRWGTILRMDRLWRRGVIVRTGVTVVLEATEDDEYAYGVIEG